MAKQVFDQVLAQGSSVNDALENMRQTRISGDEQLRKLARTVLDEHPEQVRQLAAGKSKVLGFLIGQAMKESRGNADPKQLSEIFRELTSF